MGNFEKPGPGEDQGKLEKKACGIEKSRFEMAKYGGFFHAIPSDASGRKGKEKKKVKLERRYNILGGELLGNRGRPESMNG